MIQRYELATAKERHDSQKHLYLCVSIKHSQKEMIFQNYYIPLYLVFIFNILIYSNV